MTYGLTGDDADGADLYLDLAAAGSFGTVSRWTASRWTSSSGAAAAMTALGSVTRSAPAVAPLATANRRMDAEGLPPGRPRMAHPDALRSPLAASGFRCDIRAAAAIGSSPSRDERRPERRRCDATYAAAYLLEMVVSTAKKMKQVAGQSRPRLRAAAGQCRRPDSDPVAALACFDYDGRGTTPMPRFHGSQPSRGGGVRLVGQRGAARQPVIAAIRAAMSDNLDTPAALEVVRAGWAVTPWRRRGRGCLGAGIVPGPRCPRPPLTAQEAPGSGC